VLHVEGKLIVLAAAFGIADLALLAVNITIDRYLLTTDATGQPLSRSPRVLTLLPLLRNIAMITLGVMLVLMVLGQFGVNIAPLLAGAGVVGVAIGFGSQKLVQDVITGAFMLFENTMAIGDTVQIGTNTGTVESMTIRTIRIRDSSGQLHTLPFSSVTTVVNMSRDYAFYNFTLHISYDASVDKAIQVIGHVVAEMRADPSLAPDILSFNDIVGVNALTDSAVELAGSIKVPPLRQYSIGPIFNRRIKEAFDREGIKFARPTSEIRLVRDQPRIDNAS
jgi:small conductance mechanosensitive channel